MTLSPEALTKGLADATRLRITTLLSSSVELCVCELTHAMQLDQPKISRHLAILRKSGLVMDRRAGQWIHYRLHPDLPHWAVDVIRALSAGSAGKIPYQLDRERLESMQRSSAAGICS